MQIPKLADKPLYFQVIEEVSYPNRKGYNAVNRLNPGGPPRRIQPGDYDLYGRVVNWALDGKVTFIEQPTRADIKGTAKVED